MKVCLSSGSLQSEIKLAKDFPTGAVIVDKSYVYGNSVWQITKEAGTDRRLLTCLQDGLGLPISESRCLYRALRPGEVVTIERE